MDSIYSLIADVLVYRPATLNKSKFEKWFVFLSISAVWCDKIYYNLDLKIAIANRVCWITEKKNNSEVEALILKCSSKKKNKLQWHMNGGLGTCLSPYLNVIFWGIKTEWMPWCK